LAVPFIANAGVIERPSSKYENLAVKEYGWLHDIKETSMALSVNDTAQKFISVEALKRYLKLKTRNFIKDIEVVENAKGSNHNYLYLKLELFKYNKKSEIYFGLVSLKLDSAISWKGDGNRIYELTTSIAGSDSRLNRFIKEEIDSLAFDLINV
jgi:hypothetical protein